MTAKISDKLICSFPKAADLTTRVKITRVDGREFLNIRDYVPSTKTYGKGVLIPMERLQDLREALEGVQATHGVGNGKPGEGQAALL